MAHTAPNLDQRVVNFVRLAAIGLEKGAAYKAEVEARDKEAHERSPRIVDKLIELGILRSDQTKAANVCVQLQKAANHESLDNVYDLIEGVLGEYERLQKDAGKKASFTADDGEPSSSKEGSVSRPTDVDYGKEVLVSSAEYEWLHRQ